MPGVTVILTTLNSERYLVRSITSCLEQTYSDFELIVVDGGSTDRTLEIVASFDDPRIRVVHQQENSGKLPGALNLGMAESRGQYITWTQDDCWYERRAIQTMVEYLEAHPDAGLVYTDYWIVDEQGSQTGYHRVRPPELVSTEDVVQVCFLFRRGVYETVGPQDPRYHPVHEVPWRAEVARHFRIAPLHTPLMAYGVHAGSLTGRIGGWELGRMTAQALHDTGTIDAEELVRRLRHIDLDEGYADLVFRGEYASFRRRFLRGAWQDARVRRNLGLWKLFVQSLLPGRERTRGKLEAEWLQREADRQAEWIAAAQSVDGA
ncbi:MAG: glycosyltransferase family 2 protein [Anaerolineales bacterium]|nr:glycosyltransferase family 2 protein [Anaerolineales bacterium]